MPVRLSAVLFWLIAALAGPAVAADDAPQIDSGKVVGATRFLEEHPLDASAPGIRASLLQWEDKSKDTHDVVCEDVLRPVMDESIKYHGELLAQFIFGSAAYQLANPEEKGKLLPAQVAALRSMLKAYQSLLAQGSGAHIARLDEWIKDDADGALTTTLSGLVAACQQPAAQEPAAPLMAWHPDGTTSYEATEPGYGRSQRYRSDAGWIDVYTYGLKRNDWAPGTTDRAFAAEFDGVRASLRVVQARGMTTELIEGPVHDVDVAGQPFRTASFSFKIKGKAYESAAYLTAVAGQLLKYRVTVKAGTTPSVVQLAEDFIAHDLPDRLASP